ncbi:mitochondrial assembly of ribosomal large subunit protein 1 [Heteronotia binoei]|uniref:mitochondrial assembly of ribosomal large subunit protein 1 n=1 Tax=Heteronotia binoei TaxID=13085 RepID=UPI0029306DBA|nr:mitochondrial assembly of ribosomal large subunit protein 1 [Heteronotia binoei]
MWRGIRCLRALLGVPAASASAAAGRRRLRVWNAVAPSLISQVTSMARRNTSGVRSFELRGAEKAAGAESDQEGEAVGEGLHTCPDTGGDSYDYAFPTFNIDHMVSLLRQENAKDICVIQLPPEMRYCDYFVIVSGSSTRHLHAMAHYMIKMYKHLKTDLEPHVRIEGRETDNWLCIDFGNIVIHFMLPEIREIYELERLWTLRAYDDQLAQMVPESLPDDFIFGMPSEEQ